MKGAAQPRAARLAGPHADRPSAPGDREKPGAFASPEIACGESSPVQEDVPRKVFRQPLLSASMCAPRAEAGRGGRWAEGAALAWFGPQCPKQGSRAQVRVWGRLGDCRGLSRFPHRVGGWETDAWPGRAAGGRLPPRMLGAGQGPRCGARRGQVRRRLPSTAGPVVTGQGPKQEVLIFSASWARSPEARCSQGLIPPEAPPGR